MVPEHLSHAVYQNLCNVHRTRKEEMMQTAAVPVRMRDPGPVETGTGHCEQNK